MYKVGDKVRVIRGLIEDEKYGSTEDVVFDMLGHEGEAAEVVKVREDGVYKISCDDGEWWWPEKTLLPFEWTIADKIRGMTNEEMAKYICEKFCHGVGEDLILNWLRYKAE